MRERAQGWAPASVRTSAPVSVRPSATLSALLSVQACHGLCQQQHRLRGRPVPAKTKANAIISAANRSNFFFIICLLNKVRRRSASPRKKRLRQRRVNSPPRELRSRGWFSCLFPSGMFPEKQADSRLSLHNSKLNKPAREQFAVLPRTGNKKRFLCGTVTRTGADGFCRSAFNPAE